MQWQREKADSGVHGSLRPGAKQSAAADCIGLEHHPPAVFPCFPLPPLFFFLFISSLDHSPPAHPSSPFPATHFSCRLFQTADLTYHPSFSPFSLSLSLLSNGEARKGSGKKVLLVFPSASPIECDVVNEGEGVWGGRREEEHGYSLLSLPLRLPC